MKNTTDTQDLITSINNIKDLIDHFGEINFDFDGDRKLRRMKNREKRKIMKCAKKISKMPNFKESV